MNLINLRYEVKKFLGSGNYGLTYLVYDRKLKKELALKISDINSASRKVVSQLIQQFYTLKSIHNPFIIKPIELEKIYNIDENPFERDIWFYTMPYISDSKSIDIYIKENIDKPENILLLLSRLIYAINFLHQYDISHNDIQKQNILVNEYGKPILLDIFPARISKYQYFEDFKQLFDLAINSIIENKRETPEIIQDFYNFSFENQFEYNLMSKWFEEKFKNINQHLYFFEIEKVASTSLFRIFEYFDKIREKLSYNNIILWEDTESLNSLKDNFHAYMKVKLQNVVYIKEVNDFYDYLSFKSSSKISNIKDAEIFLTGSLLHEPIYIIFDNFANFPFKEKKVLIELSRKTKGYIYLIRFEVSENERDNNWVIHNIFVEYDKILSVLNIVFNWHHIDYNRFGFTFSISILFQFLKFIKSNQNYFKKAENDKIILTTKEFNKLKRVFLNYIIEIFQIDKLSKEEKNACIIFTTFKKPIPLDLLFSIKFVKIRRTIYLGLVDKKILRYYKSTNSLGIYENIIKEILEKKLKEEDSSFYIQFQTYLYENWGKTIDDKKNYIKNLKLIKSNKLFDEVIFFYRNFSIFTYYPDYSEVYDLILSLNPLENTEYYCEAFKNYFYFSLATLDLKKLNKLYIKIKNLKNCSIDKKEVKHLFEVAISIVIDGISYNISELELKIKEAEKYLNNSFISLILFYTYSNLLGWEEESKEVQEYVSKNFEKLSNLEILFYLYGISALEKHINQRQSKGLDNYYKLMSMIYNDSKEQQNWIFYLKAAHNIAVYYSSLDTEESKDKAILYTKESIYYNEQFKIYPTLLISYSNLMIDYLHKHRDHPEAINYLNKLEKMANEAYAKNAIEDEQYLFVLVKLIAYYIENWELQDAKKNINKIEKLKLQIEKYPLYFEFLAYKGLYYLRSLKIEESYKILEMIESLYNNKIYSEYTYLYFSLAFDIFFYSNDFELLLKTEEKVLKIDKNRIENIILDHDVNYLYHCIIFNKKPKKSFKERILGIEYQFKNKEVYDSFYYLYEYYEKLDEKEDSHLSKNNLSSIKKAIDKIVSYSRYTGDIFYAFCDNYVSYIITKDREYLLNALSYIKLIYSKLTKKDKKTFKSSIILQKFLGINNTFSYYLSSDKGFASFVEKSSENLSISFDIINRIFDRFKNNIEDDIKEMFDYILKFLIHFGYCTFSAIYKVDETYSIKLIKSNEKHGYTRISTDYFERCFKIFLTQSAPFIIKSISYDKLQPHIFCAIPILDYSSQIMRKDSSSVYKFDEYSYFLIFESQHLINPYWSITGEFATFLENLFSFLNNQYILTQENMYDPLTRVLVRNNFLNKLKNALSRVNSGTLLFIDIDNFKSINDLYSHDFGDKVLSEVALIIKNSVRKVDIVGRYGGEEFLVFIPLISNESAGVIAERIRTNVMNEKILNNQTITVTIGLSRYPDDSIFSDILISKAEVANRYGKLSGKNRIVLYDNKISIDTFSKQYINGLIVRDPIKTSENSKILIELLNLAQTEKANFNSRIEKGFNLIQKAMQFDYYFVLHKEKIIFSNYKKEISEFIKNFENNFSFGTSILENEVFNYCRAIYKEYKFFIGNFKNFPYSQESYNLFQLYCNTFFLNEINPL